MKRLAAVAVMVAWFCCGGAFAQRGGSHGGFSGSHGGFAGPVGGFSRGAPAFHGGFSAPRGGFSAPPRFTGQFPGRYTGPARFGPRPPSYPVGGPHPNPGQHFVSTGPRMPFTTSGHRAPYNSPYGGNRYHNGYHYHHNHVVFVNSVWPFWGWPYWGLGYPYDWGISPIFPDYPDDNDSQQSPYYLAPPTSDYDGPYQPQSEQEPAPATNYPQLPNTSFRAPYTPYGGALSQLPASAVTLVFKDGRPPERITNYLLTSKTLKVFDQPLHDIPVDQIDVEATARLNRQAGVDFSLPVTAQ